MKTFMKLLINIILVIVLLTVGFAAGFPVGQSRGFTNGCEWAIMQANILAREAGLTMPVSLIDGQFRVILKQPGHIYQRAWQLADKYDEETPSMKNQERLAVAVGNMKKH